MLTCYNIIKLLSETDEKYSVMLSNGIVPHSFGSSRIFYTDLALGSDTGENAYYCTPTDQTYENQWYLGTDLVWVGPNNVLSSNPNVRDIVNVLTNVKAYAGYHGGLYNYDPEKSPLWYTEYGESNKQIISGIKIVDKTVVLQISDVEIK
jgi:hypothetical protein